MTLALLITAVGGAWADEATITLKCGTTEKTYENVTLPWSTTADILKEVVTDLKFNINIDAITGGDGKVEKYGNEQFKVTGTFSGEATVVVSYNMGSSATITVTAPRPLMTLNEAKTVATMEEMPASDVTIDYELVRDMGYKVAFSGVPTRARLAKDGDGKFRFADPLTFQLLDKIDANNPKDITSAEGITFMVGEVEAVDFEGNTFYQLDKETLVPLADFLADAHLGNYAICAVASTGEYDGSFTSGTITLFQGYEVEVAAKEFITYYKDEPLYADTETSADAELYTISSVSGDQATLSAAIETAPRFTPLLIFNNSDEAKTFLLIPANEEPNLALTVAPEFKGTLTGTTIAASTEGQTNYAFNGKAFVFVKNAIEVGPNKAWLSVNTGEPSARITLVFDDETTGLSEKGIVNSEKFATATWYDLNGRKVAAPSKKGIYIMNGRKVVVK